LGGKSYGNIQPLTPFFVSFWGCQKEIELFAYFLFQDRKYVPPGDPGRTFRLFVVKLIFVTSRPHKLLGGIQNTGRCVTPAGLFVSLLLKLIFVTSRPHKLIRRHTGRAQKFAKKY